MKQYIPLFLLTVAMGFAGCEKKFLESQRTGQVILSDTRDYDLLLNSDQLVSSFGYPTLLLSDDIQFNPTRSITAAITRSLYTWEDDIYQDQDPALWTVQYKSINQYNVIINELEKAKGGTPAEKRRLKAEARLGTAFSHFLLLNLYANTYNVATSATDPGIPYVTSTDMYAANPGRSTVQDTYNNIIKDVTEAIPDLQDKHEMNHRGSKAAAYAFLSRVYLFTKQYELAIENADKSMAIQSTILDYKKVGFVKPASREDPELLYMRLISESNAFSMQPTAGILAILPATDIRKRLYIPSTTLLSMLGTLSAGLTTPEVLLNKAEALLRMNTPDVNGALTLLNKLNALRSTVHTPLTTTNREEALTWVLTERRRELVNSGLRWFDMRRLTKEGRLPAITRTILGTQYTLPPDSKKFTLLIPATVMNLNPGMPQNDR